MHFRVEGQTNRLYQIQATSDFLNWTNLFSTNSASGVFDYYDSDSTRFPLRFYRAKVGQ